MVEKAFEPGLEATIQVIGVQGQEQIANSIVGRKVWAASTKRAPEQAPVLTRPHPATTQRVAAVEHPHQHQADDSRERITAALPPAWVG
jgi:hypothetical protein